MPDGSRSAAFSATFADFGIVKTRSVARLVFEVPIEDADKALAMLGGVPKPAAEVHVGIARLVSAPLPAKERVPDADKSARAKQVYAESDEGRQAVTRAAILCEEPAFQRFIFERSADELRERSPKSKLTDEQMAAYCLRRRLIVDSRREIATDERALAAFLKLEGEYRDYQRFGVMA